MDPGILCFHHCRNKIFCTVIPEYCPACRLKLDRYDYNLLPFRVPYPFIKASQYPRAIVIKPTHGDFLNDYYNSKDLHIGVTSSSGCVVEFGQHGVQGVDGALSRPPRFPHAPTSAAWDQCLPVEQLEPAWAKHWDEVLLQVSASPLWTAAHYDEEKHNCFSFVLAFLRTLDCGELSRQAADPKSFCRQYVVRRTAAAGKYISLYRQLKRHSYLLQDRT